MKQRITYLKALLGLVFCLLLVPTTSVPQGTQPVSVTGQSATLLPDGRWLLIGGERNGVPTPAAQIHDPRTNKAITLPAMLTTARTQHSATLLPDGRVLILGGVGTDGKVIAATEVFNTANQRFEVITTELLPRAGHSATLLTDGRVLITGGRNNNSGSLTQAELWDYRSGKVERIEATLPTARVGHNATLLPDGRVLILGGRAWQGSGPDTATLYEPEQVRFIDLDIHAAPATGEAPPPRLAASIPQFDATDFPVHGVIALRFSRPIDVTSLNTKTVVLTGPGGAVKARVVPAEQGRLAFITPESDLWPASWYTLFVQGAADADATPVPFTAFNFRTASLGGDSQQAGTDQNAAQSAETGATISTASGKQSSNSPPTSPDGYNLKTPSGGADKARITAQGAGETLSVDEEEETFKPGKQHKGGHWRTGKELPEPLAKRNNLLLSKIPALDYQDAYKGKGAKSRSSAAAPGTASVTGQVLRLNDKPLANVTVTIGAVSVITDAEGNFTLNGIPAGRHEMVVDGLNAGPGNKEYGKFVIGVDVTDGQAAEVPPIFLPRIRKTDWIPISSPVTADRVITHPNVPGMEIQVPKGTVFRDRNGQIVTRIALVPIPLDRTPFAFPENAPVYVSVQPGGMIVQGLSPATSQGIRVVYPNFSYEQPNALAHFWRYDPAVKGWYVYGQGHASQDGAQIIPDPGVELYDSIGFMYTGNGDSPPPLRPNLSSCGGGGGGGGGDGGTSRGGDPVDCLTGLFLHERTDAMLADTFPVEMFRAYRPADTVSRPFGIGTSHRYAMYLYFPVNGSYQQVQLILPDGAQATFTRTSPGTSYNDAIFEHTSTPSRFYKARISFASGPNRWVMQLKDGMVYEFSGYAGASLTGLRDRLGNSLTITRTGGLIQRITTNSGRYLDFIYDPSNRITQIKDLTGRTWTYTYTTAGYLAKATYPDATFEEYTYDTAGRMLTVKDRRSNIMVTNVYDANGRVAQQTLADGGIYLFTYLTDTAGKVTQTDVTDPRGFVRRITFHSSGWPASETYALGRPEQQSYTFVRDSAGLLLSRTDALGRNTTYTYDVKGNTTSVTRLAGTTSAVTDSYTYTADYSQLATSKNPLGYTSTYSYDSLGRLTQLQDPLGNLSKFTYNIAGQVLTVTDPLNKITTFNYDLGDLRSVTDPLNRTTTYFTDILGRTAAVTDPLGNKTLYTYDSLGRPIKITDPLNQSTTLSYDGNSNLLQVIDAKGGQTQYSYDAKNRLASQTDPLLKSESYQYDGNNNLTRYTDRKGQITNYTYDARNRRIQVSYADASNIGYTYDAGDRLTTLNDSQSGAISRSYDGLNRLTQETTPQGSMSYSYDAASRRTALTVAGQPAVTYTYDNASRLTKITQGTQSTLFTYDAASRRTKVTLPNTVSTTVTYDAAGQVTQLSYTKGTTSLGTLSYSYDLGGRRTSTGGTLAKTGLPNALGAASHNLANQLNQWGAQALSYDANGNLLSDGATTYTWDARNRLSALSGAQTASFKYDPLGRRIQKTLAGVTTQFLYDGVNSVQEQGPAVTPIDTVWVEDNLPAGAVANPISTTNEPWSWVSSNPTPYSGSLAHPSLLQSGTHQHYFTNATATLSVNPGDTLYAYVYLDPANPPSEVMLQWYDSSNSWEHRAYWGTNLIAVGTNGTNSRRYMGALPAAGQWIKLEVPASQVGLEGMTIKGMAYTLYNGRATWDKAGKVSSGSGTVNYLTGLGIDERFSRSDSTGTQSYLTDALGSTLALADSAGTLQTQYSYDPFGNTTTTGAASTNPFQYTGRENDGNGLYYYRARYYSPSLQRFVSSDPIGLAGGINTYSYVGGNPISRIDPLGLDWLFFNGNYLIWVNNQGQFVAYYPATSGPFGNGSLPNGNYVGTNLRARTNSAMSCGGNGFSLDVDPLSPNGRDLLRIHPDGNGPGTEGCIGVACAYSDPLYEALNNYFNGNSSIPIWVSMGMRPQ